MLLSPTAIEAGLGIIEPGDFYDPGHAHIAQAIAEQYEAGETVDPVSVAAALRARGLLEECGGIAALGSLQSGAPSTSGAPTYARIISEHARRRRMIGLAAELAEAGYAEDDERLAQLAERIVSVPEVGRVRVEIEDLTAAVEGEETGIVPTILEMTA